MPLTRAPAAAFCVQVLPIRLLRSRSLRPARASSFARLYYLHSVGRHLDVHALAWQCRHRDGRRGCMQASRATVQRLAPWTPRGLRSRCASMRVDGCGSSRVFHRWCVVIDWLAHDPQRGDCLQRRCERATHGGARRQRRANGSHGGGGGCVTGKHRRYVRTSFLELAGTTAAAARSDGRLHCRGTQLRRALHRAAEWQRL
mmetsp:Transcript_25544/g.64929  ORF Transcript_25544/g.64929 Transcript_25544/m.64929 type:complete len:201 (-) Transcript_25544:724-1326(-)